jgi:hypothetical protein
MRDKPAAAQGTRDSFWKRLYFVLEQMGESYEEQLEKRIYRLETEVSRLSRILNDDAKNGGRTSSQADLT